MGTTSGGRRVRCVVVMVLFAASLTGVGGSSVLAGEEPSAPMPNTAGVDTITNEHCPVMPDELTDPDIWVEYKGKRVYFCCQKCKHKFERDPEKYVTDLAAFSTPSEDPFGDAAAALLGDEPPLPDDASEPDEHAHTAGKVDEHDHDHGARLPRVLEWLGEFHMASVSFPVGLLLAGALAEVLLMMTKRASYASAARFCVWIGALGSLVSGVLGWFHAGVQILDDDWMLATHRWLGTTTTVLALAALVLSESHARKPDAPGRTHRYRVALFLSALLVTATGFFGGAMVYGIDHYAW